MNEILIKISRLLNSKLKWAIFGGVAVAVYNGKFHRQFDDVDIIIENKVNLIKEIFSNYKNSNRKGRKKGEAQIDNKKIEFLFMTSANEIDLADGKFKFNAIEEKEFNGIKLPVIDLQSLYYAKLRYKQFLEQEKKEKHKDKLKNTNIDLDVLKKLIDV